MSKISPKLNLNKTPQLVENNSLVMAKNIRLLEDGTIGPDTSLELIQNNTGGSTTTTIHHDAVVENVVEFQYTIFDYETVMSIQGGTNINQNELENYAFDFTGYAPDRNEISTNQIQVLLKPYVKENTDNPCVIYCYIYDNYQIKWTAERFECNINEGTLVNSGGRVLLLACYSDSQPNISSQKDNKKFEDEKVPIINDYPKFFYVVLPKSYIGKTIMVDKAMYDIYNPVYITKSVKEIIVKEAYDEIIETFDTAAYIGQIVGLDNKIYIFKECNYVKMSNNLIPTVLAQYPGETFTFITPTNNELQTLDINSDGYLTRNGIIVENLYLSSLITPNLIDRIKIFEYDEVKNTFTVVKCGWKYSNGKINGCVFKNNTGKTILTICEYGFTDGTHVPIKHIDLSSCTEQDDESIYTQNPNIPITNLILSGEYSSTIPAGVYQFFIRYKIHDNRYTSWFPCSKECYAGTKKRIATIQGELKYIDKHSDSDTSFIFNVQHLFNKYNNIYKKFQIGFILSKDDNSIVAKEWKEFDLNTGTIYFDYFTSDIKEANIDDLLETTYELFNVNNCVNFKNKLYIANYEESDFNPTLQSFAENIAIKINTHTIGSQQNGTYFNGELLISSFGNTRFDLIGDYYSPINAYWAISPHFILSHIAQSSDERAYYNSIPFISSNHHHIENSNVGIGYSHGGWIDDDGELHNNSYSQFGIPSGWVNSDKHFEYNKAQVLAIYIKDNNSWIDITGQDFRSQSIVGYDDSTQRIIKINNTNNNTLCITCDTLLRSRLFYFDTTNNSWYIKCSDNNYHKITDYYIVYSVVEVVKRETVQLSNIVLLDNTGQQVGCPKFDVVHTKKTTKILKRTIVFDTSIITSTVIDDKKYPTLLPFSNYNFYVHYIKANGVVTNGYLINDTPVRINKYTKKGSNTISSGNVTYDSYGNIIGTVAEDDIIYYPSFSNIKKPNGYVGCFISASKTGNNVCQLFNVTHSKKDKLISYKADCLELDTSLYTKFNNLCIYDSNGNEVTNSGKYYDSGNTEDVTFFGECGSVVWEQNNISQSNGNDDDNIFWLVIKTNESNNKLIKYTPYIRLGSSPVNYSNYEDINNIGFTCFVKKLKKDNLYINGSDVYTISRDNAASGSNAKLVLTEATNLQYFMLIRDNNEQRIKSNFNLEYMTLSEDITAKSKTIHTGNENSETRLVCMVNSLISSYIYEYKQCYKDYTKKVYIEVQDEKQTIFNNTIRASRVIKDEEYNTFKFNATDYYNVPTLRGIITNIISVVNTLYVHCEHSLFKFTDNKTINAQEEEVTLQENDIFNSGISEVFDAQYGYAGLKTREQSIVTYNAYVFYDAIAKTIYAFGGEQQIGNISDPIKKLINTINPTDVRFVADEPHNRFFVNLINNSGNVCLSFNFNAKSFVSIHDFHFKFGFHSRRHTYFINESKQNGAVVDWSIYRIIDFLKVRTPTTPSLVPGDDPTEQEKNNIAYEWINNYVAYQSCYKKSLIRINDYDNDILNEVKAANSGVDIIVNTEYEKIKVLNYIGWICSEITDYGRTQNFVAEEKLNREYPGTKLRIYSDSTSTNIIELLDSNGNPKISNNERNIDQYGNPTINPNSYQYIQYNCGIWNMNYFRDIINTGDIFKYKHSSNKITGGIGHSQTTDLTPKNQRQNLTQESSLIYGKYFVLRFIFNNKNFKLENIIVKMNDYGKEK